MSEDILRWLVAFAITQAVECPVYSKVFGISLRTAFLASTLTHPVVVFVVPAVWRVIHASWVARGHEPLAPLAYATAYGALAETFAFLAETLWFHLRTRLSLRRAAFASLVGNAASCTLGGLTYAATGWP